MRAIKSIFFVGVIIFLLAFTGCYTIVMVPKVVVHRGNTGNVITEEEPGEYAETDSLGAPTTIYKYYIYGDLLPGYVYFDPYWASPYWWHYSSWWPYWGYFDPWFWDYSWPYWYSGYYSPWYSPFYYSSWYYDPYWAYWDGYYSTVPVKRRPFSRRRAFADQTASYAPSASALSGSKRLSKKLSTEATGNNRRVRKEFSNDSINSKSAESLSRSGISARRIRKSSSETVVKKTPARKSSGGAIRVRKRKSSSLMRRILSRRQYSNESHRVRRSSTSYTSSPTYHPIPIRSSSSSGSYTRSSSSSGHSSPSSHSGGSRRRRK